MRARVVSLVLLLALGCATRDSVAPEPAPPPSLAAPEAPAPVAPDPEREARIREAEALKTGAKRLIAQGRPGQAIALLQRAVLLDSDDAEAQGMLGSLLLQIGRFPLAALSYERMLELTPDDPRVYVGLGTAYHKMGRYQDAREPLIKALESYPNDYSLMLQLGRVGYLTNDYGLCARSFRRFVGAIEERDPALLPETYKQDYQRALSFAERCEAEAR